MLSSCCVVKLWHFILRCLHEWHRTFSLGNESRCFVKFNEKLSWFKARNNCTSNNGDLASFGNISLLNGIVDTNGSWIGLRHSQWNWQNAGWSTDCMSLTTGGIVDLTCQDM